MARSLTAIRVVIGLTDRGQAQYPDFNSLPVVQASGMDWSIYVDREGEGWHYDQVSGHRDDDVGSPYGTQLGLLLIPRQFAVEAVAAFPAACTRLTEVECQDFYDNRAHIRERENHEDVEILQAIQVREQLDERGKPSRSAEDLKALDPDDPAPGIRKNHNRFWADFKARKGITFDARA